MRYALSKIMIIVQLSISVPIGAGLPVIRMLFPKRPPAYISLFNLIILVVLSGCVVGPDYRTPTVATPIAWHSETPGNLKRVTTESSQLALWWKGLNDPLLSILVEEALANNQDLKQAQARLRESRARRGLSNADRFPTVNASSSDSRNRSSAEMGMGSSQTSKTVSAQLDASLDMDLFGGKKRALEAASATLEAAEENVRDVQVSLVAEVVLTYIEIRTSQARIDNTRSTIDSLEESSQIAYWRNQAGLVSQLDIEQALSNLEQTRASTPSLLNTLEQAKNNLAFLMGLSYGALTELLAVAPIPTAPDEIAIGVPAETLRQRPDIRRAERQLAAATAQVGEAEAARYPNLSLSGTVGLQATSLGSLLNSGAFIYTLANNAAMTIFDAGRLKQKVEIQNALQEQALITYQSAVRSALRDVENALVAYAEELNRRQSLKIAVSAAENAAKLSTSQYVAGLVDYSTVLENQKSLLSIQDQFIQSEAAVTSNMARLYKALGGGWSPDSTVHNSTSITLSGEKR